MLHVVVVHNPIVQRPLVENIELKNCFVLFQCSICSRREILFLRTQLNASNVCYIADRCGELREILHAIHG